MKALARLTALTVLIAALTNITLAASKNQGNFTLNDTARVGATDLRPGDYKAEWTEEAGGTVKVQILQHGKTVATAEAKLKDLQQPAPYNAVVTRKLGDNANTIDEIDFDKHSLALAFGE